MRPRVLLVPVPVELNLETRRIVILHKQIRYVIQPYTGSHRASIVGLRTEDRRISKGPPVRYESESNRYLYRHL